MMEDEHKQEDDLRLENGIKKMKLSLEHGGEFHSNIDSQAPPEVENEWLNYIEQFEQLHRNAKRISVYDFIGRPEWKASDDIPDTEIANEMDRIWHIMKDNGVGLETICEVDERVLYRFVTEELFNREIDDVRIKGMLTCFTYEDFYPNHEYDIDRICRDFIDLFIKDTELPDPGFMWFHDEMKVNGRALTKSGAKELLDLFKESFHPLTLNEYKVLNIDIADDSASLVFQLTYNGYCDNEHVNFAGQGKFSMVTDFGFWHIAEIEMPGAV